MEDLWNSVRWLARASPQSTRPGTGWPCTVLVALATRRAYALDDDPEFADGSPWWREVNIWDVDAPLSPMPAYASMASGGIWNENLAPADMLTWLDPDDARWWVVQGWAKGGWGHQFLVEALDDGTFRVLESTEEKGLEVNDRPWSGGDLPPSWPQARLLEKLEMFDETLGSVPLFWLPTPTQKEAPVAAIRIPEAVSEEILEQIKDMGADALGVALDELAAANEDGRLDPDDAKSVARAIFDELVEGVAVLGDLLLPLPEPYEALSDLGIEAAKDVILKESGILDDLAEIVRDFFDGPEVEEILAKLTKHAGERAFGSKASAARKERKHAWRLLRKFPEIAAALGISGGSKAELVLGYHVERADSGEYSLVKAPA